MSEEPPKPPLSRIIGAGARAGDHFAHATGIDAALDQAIEEAIVRAFRSQALRRALERALSETDPHTDIDPEELRDLLRKVLSTETVAVLWGEVLASEQVQMLVERMADAPEVRSAMTAQGAGMLTDLGARLTRLTEALDDAVERFIRPRARDSETNQAGLATRALAGAVDIGLLFTLYTLGSGILSSILGSTIGGKFSVLAILILTGLAALIGAGIVVTFWALVGQTPGMRFLSIRVIHQGTHELGLWVASKRMLVLLCSGGLGFLWIARDRQRRGFHDIAARTEVIYDDLKSSAPYSHRAGTSGYNRAGGRARRQAAGAAQERDRT